MFFVVVGVFFVVVVIERGIEEWGVCLFLVVCFTAEVNFLSRGSGYLTDST